MVKGYHDEIEKVEKKPDKIKLWSWSRDFINDSTAEIKISRYIFYIQLAF